MWDGSWIDDLFKRELYEACTSRDHFFFFFLSLDFHELWRSVMSICVFTEVKLHWAMLVLGWVTASCTSCVSDVFVAHASRPKPLSALLLQQ